MTRRACFITGTRAEFGLLRWVMDALRRDDAFELQLIATGTHLSPEFGSTYLEIEQSGFHIDRKVEMLLQADTATAVTKSMGVALIGLSDALAELRPDIVVLLGDRFEMLSAASAALIARIPIAHLHGGERTEGAFDESLRHAITKMSHLHFVANEEYRRRVIQLGEAPERVFTVGGLGVDALRYVQLLDRPALEESLGFSFGERSLLVTFHPTTLEDSTAGTQMTELLAALDSLEDTQLVITMPNADTGGREIMNLIRAFVESRPRAKAFASLGQQRYLSCLQYVDGVVGNSSSGLTEVPTFRKGTINIGDRQRGRLKAESVVDCEPDRAAISAALARLFSPEFQARLPHVRNPYGDGGASEKIVSILRDHPLDVLKKVFHDIDYTLR